MGALVAVVQKGEPTAASTVSVMLKELAHRGKDAYGIASAKQQTLSDSLEKLNPEKTRSNIALGYIFSKILPTDTPQLITTENFTLAFEGRIYPPQKTAEKLKPAAEDTAESIIKNCNGDYTFAIATSNSLIVGRDVVGVAPLYFGRNETLFAIASERKALWKLGLKAESFPPGNIAKVEEDTSFSFKPVRTVKQLPLTMSEIDPATKRLHNLLQQSTENRVSDVKEVAVAFSGGLDSSIVAFLAKECGVKARLITVGLENMPETTYAEKAAGALNMPIHVNTYTLDDVEKVLPKMLWLIEEPNFINASIAIPFYWTAELAASLGLDVLLAGQGADELFGGYHRYLTTYAERGVDALQKTLFNDVANCYETNFQRDNKTCTFHGVDLRLPFADLRVVNFALSLPLQFKIESSSDKLRKKILRKVAENMGLPSFIVNKRKKAVQYATGVNKALRKLAKRENLNPSAYVRKVFRETFPDVKTDD
jgi:asparagine synthase (glutamine-hydrolysing)